MSRLVELTSYPGPELAAQKILDWLEKRKIVENGKVTRGSFTFEEIENTYRIRVEKNLKWMTKDMLTNLVETLNSSYVAIRDREPDTACNIERAIYIILPQK